MNTNTCSIKLDFPNCSDAATSFFDTEVKAFNKYMLQKLGSNKQTVNIDTIMNNVSATTDFLYYVIDKLTDFSPYYQNTAGSIYSTFTFVNNKGQKLDTVYLSSIFNFPSENKYPSHLTSINSLNVSDKQYVRVDGMFDSFDKWT